MELQLLGMLLLTTTIRLTMCGTHQQKIDRNITRTFCEDPGSELQQCPPPRRGSSCHCIFNNKRDKILCCHIDLRRLNTEIAFCVEEQKVPDTIRALYVKNCTTSNDELNFANLGQKFPIIETISLMDGDYRTIKQLDSKTWNNKLYSNLTCLILSNNALQESDGIANIINAIPTLRLVDLSFNNLTYAPELNNRTRTLWLRMAENPQLKCDGIREAITQRNISFLNSTETECRSQSNFEWFNSTDRIPLLQIEVSEKIKRDCPHPCACVVNRLMYSGDKGSLPFFSTAVDCSSLQLSELPKKLPDMTVSLNISNNSITSLEPLISKNNNYEHIKKLYADYNHISSIQVLEGSKFIQNFEVFSLRHNKLEKLTLHILTNAFDKNWSSKEINLGDNHFVCDCHTYNTLKDWLIKYKKNIPDYNEIYCKDTQRQSVLAFKQESVCFETVEFAVYTYYLIGAEVALLLLLVGKVSYDYWVFKNAGYLPWPASKMPKLPCDCVLER